MRGLGVPGASGGLTENVTGKQRLWVGAEVDQAGRSEGCSRSSEAGVCLCFCGPRRKPVSQAGGAGERGGVTPGLKTKVRTWTSGRLMLKAHIGVEQQGCKRRKEVNGTDG